MIIKLQVFLTVMHLMKVLLSNSGRQSSQKDYKILLREVQALAHLDHPHIVRYHSTWVQWFTLPPQLVIDSHIRHRFKRHRQRTAPIVAKSEVPNLLPTSSVRIEELSR